MMASTVSPDATAALKSTNFATKPAVPGNAGEREREDRQQRGEARALAREAGEVVEAVAVAAGLGERHQHGEGAEVREDVDEQVEEDGAVALDRAGGEADQQVAGVRDARVGEQPLQVVLDHRHHVADDDRQRREHPEQIGEARRDGTEGLRQQPQQRHERRHLHGDRHVRGDRGRRAFVDVGRPLVERHRRHLEREAHDHQREPDRPERVARREARCGCASKSSAPVTP